MTGEGIDTQAALTISAAVVALATLIRWAAPGDSISGTRALLVVCGLSAVGVALWVISLPVAPSRQWAFGIFQAWISVSLQAAGVYGFATASTRAQPAAEPEPQQPQKVTPRTQPAAPSTPARVSRY